MLLQNNSFPTSFMNALTICIYQFTSYLRKLEKVQQISPSKKIFLKNLYGAFSLMWLNCFKDTEPLRGDSPQFTISPQEYLVLISSTQKEGRLSQPVNHSPRNPYWERSTLNTRLFLQFRIQKFWVQTLIIWLVKF